MKTACPDCLRPLPTDAITAHEGGCTCLACMAACWASWGHRESCEARQGELLALARRLTAHVGVAALVDVAALLDAGDTEAHRGQTADDHLQHALDHLLVADNEMSPPREERNPVDPSSGKSQFAHGAARCLLGLKVLRAGEG